LRGKGCRQGMFWRHEHDENLRKKMQKKQPGKLKNSHLPPLI